MSHPAVVSRNPNQLDAFVVDSAGGLHTSWWNPTDDWTDHGWRDITLGLPPLPGGAPVAVVSRNPNQLDAFVVDSAGGLHTSWWTPIDDWTDHGWRDITLGLPPLPGGAPVAVVSRNPNQLDAFVVDSAGRLHTSWWTPTDDWTDHAWRDITAMALGPPSPVSHSVP